MKILNASQIREADAFTIENEPISSIDLMERASRKFCDWFTARFDQRESVVVFCGMGNNGGDGLAIARILHQGGYQVTVHVVKKGDKGAADFEINAGRFAALAEINYISTKAALPDVDPKSIVIDAIFGSGLSRPIEGLFAEVVHQINRLNCTKIAVDIASGLFADRPSTGEAIVKPDYTISFQVPKVAFFMPENEEFVGQLHVVDIGLDRRFLEKVSTPHLLLQHQDIALLLQRRKKFSHKGDFGKVLLVSGSYGKVGATVLAARAALRTGTGLLTIHAPACAYTILQTAVPEAMVVADAQKKKITKVAGAVKYDVVGVGPGIGKAEKTQEMLSALLKATKSPMVLDADALNILGQKKILLKQLPGNSILTPHPKEFERIAGSAANSFERLELQKQFSKKYECITIVKGAHTTVCTPAGEVYFNNTGNPGMATGGSGDVLTGMITSLLGQKYPPVDAALIGVYLHGLAGDLAAEKLGQEAMLPSDLVEHISDAYKIFRQ